MNCPQTRKTHDREFELNYVNPVKRTTVPVPNNGSIDLLFKLTIENSGFVIVRFKADNPGLWFMHCHLFSHMRKGQALVLDVSDQGVPKDCR